MVGIFKLWSVSGITTEAAKLSEPLTELGGLIAHSERFKSLSPTEKTNFIALGKQLLAMHEVFTKYLDTGNKKYHDDAVKFLVMIGAIALGTMGIDWDWKNVREYSQGIYSSMMDERYSFDAVNIPQINDILKKTTLLIESAVG